jgi:hypothetical protein
MVATMLDRVQEVLRPLAAHSDNYLRHESGAPYVDDLKGPVVRLICRGQVAKDYVGDAGAGLIRDLVSAGLLAETEWDGAKGHRTFRLTQAGQEAAGRP